MWLLLLLQYWFGDKIVRALKYYLITLHCIALYHITSYQYAVACMTSYHITWCNELRLPHCTSPFLFFYYILCYILHYILYYIESYSIILSHFISFFRSSSPFLLLFFSSTLLLHLLTIRTRTRTWYLMVIFALWYNCFSNDVSHYFIRPFQYLMHSHISHISLHMIILYSTIQYNTVYKHRQWYWKEYEDNMKKVWGRRKVRMNEWTKDKWINKICLYK